MKWLPAWSSWRASEVCHSADVDDGRYALPGGEMGDLYSHRWEISNWDTEEAQTMQCELLGCDAGEVKAGVRSKSCVLLAGIWWDIRMIKMVKHLKGYWPNQLSFFRIMRNGDGEGDDCRALHRDVYRSWCAILRMGQSVKLPTRRERAFPRVVKERPRKCSHMSRKSQLASNWPALQNQDVILFQHQSATLSGRQREYWAFLSPRLTVNATIFDCLTLSCPWYKWFKDIRLLASASCVSGYVPTGKGSRNSTLTMQRITDSVYERLHSDDGWFIWLR